MKVGLWNMEKDKNPINIALEKIRLYHQEKGDEVEDYFNLARDSYDKIYISSIFDFTKKDYIRTDNMVEGGTGLIEDLLRGGAVDLVSFV